MTTDTATTPQDAPDAAEKAGPLTVVRQLVARHYLVLVLVALCVAVGAARPSFWGVGNLSNVLFQASFVGLAACGMTMLIAAGLLDLSVGGVIAVASIAVATVLPHTTIGGAIALALVIGAVLGLVNGLLVTYVKIAPFIATLGTLYLFLGLAFIWTSGKVVPITSSNYRATTTGTLGWVPVPFLVFVVLAFVTYLVLQRTYFGRTLRAFGSNERAAELAGLPVARVKVGVFVVAGICFALAGVFMAGRLSSAEGNMAMGFEMDVIAAVVVGGTALRGGRATTFGTVVGAVLFAVLANALNLLAVASYWQYVLTGTVLVTAVALGARRSAAAEVRGAG
ncbi:MAG: ABC transporter permease [Cellulomonas sp.]|jgi:ribose transport system permease protein|uniref:ABC transporter permease n=1 Tax=Cellulomonas sp. TaxID=40001 RepID=UPI0019EBB6E8|nr:ABC transporter permease [Cellulomonas sp.]MBF0687403.1 ABC transporter permease [Cellulomonas sp.]